MWKGTPVERAPARARGTQRSSKRRPVPEDRRVATVAAQRIWKAEAKPRGGAPPMAGRAGLDKGVRGSWAAGLRVGEECRTCFHTHCCALPGSIPEALYIGGLAAPCAPILQPDLDNASRQPGAPALAEEKTLHPICVAADAESAAQPQACCGMEAASVTARLSRPLSA
mmetsp:Transcript_6058/g.16880  ORF Transcript_6058/g.16880 Transcript_6058/m.16880 type:complete len:169 (-) Transcript_6058:284-790(-)